MGNGFSRMLQKLNLDARREDFRQNLSFSDGEDKPHSRNHSEEKNKRKTGLPQLRTRQQIDSQPNNEENKKEETFDKLVKGIINHKEPKLVKIYKKIKGINDMNVSRKEFNDQK